MEDKLKEILDSNLKELQRYTDIKEGIINKIRFCSEHKFDEEVRVARIEYNAMDMLLYQYKTMHRDLTELLNNWNS